MPFSRERAREARALSGLSQYEVAERLSQRLGKRVYVQIVSNWERGVVPTVDNMEALADIYGVGIDFFMTPTE